MMSFYSYVQVKKKGDKCLPNFKNLGGIYSVGTAALVYTQKAPILPSSM